MNEYEDFARCVEKFFMEYLVKERGTSHHTIRSYRDTLVLFITYMQDKEHVKAENLSFYHVHDLRGPKAYVTMERHLYHTAKKGF